jgi:acetylornithine deacetylase
VAFRDVVALARELIAIPSPSHQSNAPLAERLAQYLRALEFDPLEQLEYADSDGVRKVCLVARRGSGSEGLAFFCHSDTVPGLPWSEGDPYSPVVRNGRLYGRGSCDMKGPIACVLAACARVPPHQQQFPLYLVCTADEEVGCGGAEVVAQRSQIFRELCQQKAAGIVTEPTQLQVVYAHKAAIWLVATARGRASHSSVGEKHNPNLKMIDFLWEAKKIYLEFLSDRKWWHPEFDPPTPGWNIVIDNGGLPPNIVPPHSTAYICWRPMPGQDKEEILRRVFRMAEELGIELFVRGAKLEPLYTPPDSRLVRRVLAVASSARPTTVPYATDGCIFGRYLPLVVFGPGSIEQAHTPDEWIALEQLRAATDRYARLIEDFCCRVGKT